MQKQGSHPTPIALKRLGVGDANQSWTDMPSIRIFKLQQASDSPGSLTIGRQGPLLEFLIWFRGPQTDPNCSPRSPRFGSLVSFPDHRDVYGSRVAGSPKLSEHQPQFEALLSANSHLGVNFLTSFSSPHTCRWGRSSFSSIGRSVQRFLALLLSFQDTHGMIPGGQPRNTRAKFRPARFSLKPDWLLDRGRRNLHAIGAEETDQLYPDFSFCQIHSLRCLYSLC